MRAPGSSGAGRWLTPTTLENKIRAWTRDPQRKAGIELGKRYNPKCHRIDVFVTDVQPLPVDWGLILGDVANNFRSCLDHIAWALVTRGRTPPDTLSRWGQNKIYFPIYDDGVDFNDSLPLKLPGVRRADIAVVRRYQPYKHGKLGAPLHAFALLAAISNEDKHRSVQPVPALPAHASYKIVETRDCEVTRWGGNFFATRLEVGTKLAPIYVRKKGPHPDVGVEGRLSAYPVLNHNVKLEDWLAETPRFVSALLQEFGDAPSAEFLESLSFVTPN